MSYKGQPLDKTTEKFLFFRQCYFLVLKLESIFNDQKIPAGGITCEYTHLKKANECFTFFLKILFVDIN